MLSQVVRASRRGAPPRRSALRLGAPRYQHLARRTLSTSPSPENGTDTDPNAEVYDALHSAPSPPSTSTSTSPRPGESRATRTAFVRTWKPLNNIADAYAMIRAIERKYGKILEVHFLRDFEVPTNYQTMSWVIFADSKSLQRIPERGFEFTIPTSGVKKEPHELGMEDLERVAKEGEYQEGFELLPVDPESDQEIIGGRIIRAERDYLPETIDRTLFQSTAKTVMRSWLQWGGFAKLTPLDSSRTIRADHLFDPRKEAKIDQIRMRASLQLAAMVTNTQNPAVRQVPREESKEKEEEPSFGSTVFSGLLEAKAKVAANEGVSSGESPDALEVELLASEPSTSATDTAPSSLAPETENIASTSTSSSPTPETPTPPPKQARQAPTPEQIAEKEALERQLEVARQLRERVSPTRRKQAKPTIRTSRLSVRAAASSQRQQQPELEFFEGEKVEEEVFKETAKPSGVLGRLFGFLKR